MRDIESALRASRRSQPYIIFNLGRLTLMPPFPFPQLPGGTIPAGWRLTETRWACYLSTIQSLDPTADGDRLRREIRTFLAALPEEQWLKCGFGVVPADGTRGHVYVFQQEEFLC